MTGEERKVILASSVGTVFEWYDFYIYGTLATILAKQFFSGVEPQAAFIFTLLAFAAGFAVRPFGALVFGHIGDLVGRKYTFIITITCMGLGTFLIGVLPSFASAGIVAPILLIALRLLQGLALGGEYGGAAIYVAEHAPKGKRGLYTSWIQTQRRWACSWRCCSFWACAPTSARTPSAPGAGGCRSWSPLSCWQCRCGSACSSTSRRCS